MTLTIYMCLVHRSFFSLHTFFFYFSIYDTESIYLLPDIHQKNNKWYQFCSNFSFTHIHPKYLCSVKMNAEEMLCTFQRIFCFSFTILSHHFALIIYLMMGNFSSIYYILMSFPHYHFILYFIYIHIFIRISTYQERKYYMIFIRICNDDTLTLYNAYIYILLCW